MKNHNLKGKGALAVLGLGVLLAGCAQESGAADSSEIEQQTETAAEEAGESAEEKASVCIPATEYLTEEEMERADLWQSCDDTALAALMRRARDGEAVTIACIGGSITQGTVSAGTKDGELEKKLPYAEILQQWWEETFPQSRITFINAGIGGTDSYLGVHRLDREILAYDPDLVLVEFSVNDSDNGFYKKSYDNLVRNLLQSESHPAVMLLYMAQTNGISAQDSHLLVGFHYKVPMVSYGNVIGDMMESGHYTESELSGDGVHPSALGHAIAGEILWKYLNRVYENCDTFGEVELTEWEPVTTAAYEDAKLLDGKELEPEELGDFYADDNDCEQFPDGWCCESGEGGIVFRTEFRRLGLLYLKTTDGQSGQYEIYVDGEAVRSVDANFEDGWGNAITADEVYVGEERTEHTVEIRRKEGSTGEKFSLLGLLIS